MGGYLRRVNLIDMGNRRFRTRRQWSNSRAWATAAAGIVVLGLALTALVNAPLFVEVALGLALLGFPVAFYHDRGDDINYVMHDQYLTLRRKHQEEVIDLAGLRDASLVDRRSAREMLMERVRSLKAEGAPAREVRRVRADYMRFCSVDIGLSTLTFGIGRTVMDHHSDAKHDLVLLRLRSGRSVLLSPVYNHDLVEAINRSVHPPEQRHRA